MDGLCHLQRASNNSVSVQLSSWTTRACIGLHLVSTRQSAFLNITEQMGGRTNTLFHLMREVYLEEYNELPLVDSGLGPRLSILLQHLGNSPEPRLPLVVERTTGLWSRGWQFVEFLWPHPRHHDSMAIGPELPRKKQLGWATPGRTLWHRSGKLSNWLYNNHTILWAFWPRGKTSSKVKDPLVPLRCGAFHLHHLAW